MNGGHIIFTLITGASAPGVFETGYWSLGSVGVEETSRSHQGPLTPVYGDFDVGVRGLRKCGTMTLKSHHGQLIPMGFQII